MDRHRGGAADRYGDSRPYRNSRAPPPPPPRGDKAYPIKNHHNNHNHTSPDGSYFNSGFSSGGRDRGGVNSPPRFSGGGGGGGGRGPGFRGRGGAGNFDQRSPNGGGGRGGMGNFDKQGPGSGGGRGGAGNFDQRGPVGGGGRGSAGNFDQRGPSGGGGRGNFDHQGPPASGGGYGPGNFDQQGVVGGGERGNFDYHGPITGGGYGHGNFDQQGPISGGERGNFDHQGPVSRGGRGGVVNYDEQGPVSVGGRGGMSNFDQQGPISGRAHGDFDQQGPLSGGARGNFEQQDSVSGGGRGNFDRQGPISGGRGNFDQQGPVSGVGRGNFDQQGPVSGGGRGGAVNFDHQGPVISGGRGGAVNFDQQGPTTGGGRGCRVDFDPQGPVTGQKRGYPFSAPAVSPDNQDGGAFAKLFVGSVPRTATEEDIRPLFDQHGRVLEVALIKDKKTGQQQGCCFIKYATSGEADRAIRALHNQHTLPGGVGPIQVRYADGERERLGAVEYKLFVGSLNKQAIEKEVEEIFSPYGRVEDVYLMRDEMKQSRGCGFVKYSSRESAMAAINSLSGSYIMRGCDQPLTVRFADPKRPRPGESRNGPSFGGPGFGPRFQPPGLRPMPHTVETTHNHNLPNTWHPMSPQNQVPSDVGIHTRFPAPSTPGGSSSGGFSGSADGSSPVFPVSSSTVPQNYNQSKPQVPSFSQQITPVQQQPYHSSQQYPSSMQSQSAGSYPQKQTSVAQPTQSIQLGAQTPYSQTYSSQKQPGVNGQLPVSLSHNQQNLPPASTQIPSNNNVPPQSLPGIANQPQLNLQQQFPQPLHQSPSQLTAQMLSQQTQALQARLQSSQQAFSQIQQQLQMMQPSNQSFTMQQGPKASSQQTSWDGMTPQTSASSKVNPPVADGPSAATAPSVIPEMTHTAVPLKCNWTEHTSPEGFKYYYNSTTGESKWEKPEELSSFEKQQTQLQKSSVQQPQSQFQPQGLPTQQVPPNPQGQFQSQLQPQLRYPPQLQQPSQSSSYQAPGYAGHQGTQDIAYKQSPAVASSVNDPSRFQQGLQGSQEWMWKNNPTGA